MSAERLAEIRARDRQYNVHARREALTYVIGSLVVACATGLVLFFLGPPTGRSDDVVVFGSMVGITWGMAMAWMLAATMWPWVFFRPPPWAGNIIRPWPGLGLWLGLGLAFAAAVAYGVAAVLHRKVLPVFIGAAAGVAVGWGLRYVYGYLSWAEFMGS